LAQAPAPVLSGDKSSIEGTVVNAATGEPVKKARVTLAPIGRRTLPYATTTDAAGHFLIDEVEAGRYDLTASRSGYLDQSYSPRGDPNHRAVLTLETGQDLKGMVFKLMPQGAITGRILNEDGDPVSDAIVDCMSIGYERGKRRLIGLDNATTNDLGEFRLPGLRAGNYVIRATYQSQERPLVEERPVAAARAAIQAAEERYITTYYPNTTNPGMASPIEVAAGAQIGGINITLLRTRLVHIKGHVGTAGQTLLGQLGVSLSPRGQTQIWNSREVTADSRGGFQMDGVVPGPYFLKAAGVVDGKRYSAEMAIDVRDANLEGLELTLQPPAEIQGRVIVGEKGDLKGIRPLLVIHARAIDDERWVQLKDDLTFTIEGLPLGSYDLGVGGAPENFYAKSIRMGQQDVTETGIDLTSGVPAEELTVVLSPNGGTIEGSVENAQDGPVVGAMVTLIPDAGHRSVGRLYKTTNTDQNGRFVVKGVTPGEYKIYAWEEMEEGAYEDPDFMQPHEAGGEAVSVKEGGRETVRLKAIPAENTANQKAAQ
jgi:protocatechuate 3,4-dioxygenase beta subunit